MNYRTVSFLYKSLIAKECSITFFPCSAFIRPHLHNLLLRRPILYSVSCPAYSISFSSFLLFSLLWGCSGYDQTQSCHSYNIQEKNSSKIKHTGKVLECLLLLFAFFPSPVGAHLSCPVSELIPLVTGASSSSLHCLWLKTDALWERRAQNFYIPTPSPLLGCHSVLYTHTCTAFLLCLFPFLSFYLLG